MSTESIQLFATLATMALIAVGVIFAALQVREEALARRLQATTAVFADLWPPEAARASLSLAVFPPALEWKELTEEQRRNIATLGYHYNRVGYLLWRGLVKEEEILLYPPMGPLAVDLWARLSPYLQSLSIGATNVAHIAHWWEYLAWRAQRYWEQEGGRHIKETPVFTPRPEHVYRIFEEAHAQREGNQIPVPMET
ncbi:MAG: hypothetical protein C1O27_002155 [Chloroflexi bacterium]|jgi:hypothetical protein|nr:MAG: hypothetical protein C1O27_002155 [Chloroflexota bacterium]